MFASRKTHYGEKIIKNAQAYVSATIQSFFKKTVPASPPETKSVDLANGVFHRITPESDTEFRELLSLLDQQQDARKPYKKLHHLLGDGSAFFTASTGEIAVMHRKKLVAHFKPQKFIEALNIILKELLETSGLDSLRYQQVMESVIQQMTLRAMFGFVVTGELKEGLATVSQIDSFSRNQSKDEIELKEAQAKFFTWADNLFHTNINQILVALQKHKQGESNYFISHLVDHLVNQHPELKNNPEKQHFFLKDLKNSQLKIELQHPYIKTLLSVLLPSTVLSIPMTNLAKRIIKKMLEERDFDHLSEKERSVYVSAAINSFNSTPMVPRYTSKSFEYDTVQYAENSVVYLQTSAQAHTLFSTGPRRCPAADTIVRPILNAVISIMEEFFDDRIIESDRQDLANNYNINNKNTFDSNLLENAFIRLKT
ncbi:MAG: hypothetical protein ABI597_12190 [Gammaproteobacteria bacterium]